MSKNAHSMWKSLLIVNVSAFLVSKWIAKVFLKFIWLKNFFFKASRRMLYFTYALACWNFICAIMLSMQKGIKNIFRFTMCFCLVKSTSLQLSFSVNKHHIDRTWLIFSSHGFNASSNFVFTKNFLRGLQSMVNLTCIPQCDCYDYRLVLLHMDRIMRCLFQPCRGILLGPYFRTSCLAYSKKFWVFFVKKP